MILCLQKSDDLDFPEIAERIGETCDNTRNIYYRGIRKLKKRMIRKNEDLKKRLFEKKKIRKNDIES
jgi:DNA-directed RNA polymerase specialized sigma24 family protein